MRNDACGLLLKKAKTMMLRKAQNQNDADDAESEIWYRDILKTASQASSASLSSRKNAAGGLGYTPEMCMWMTTCYASKTRLPQNDDKQTRYPHKFVYVLKSESLLIHPKILTRKSESVLIHSANKSRNFRRLKNIHRVNYLIETQSHQKNYNTSVFRYKVMGTYKTMNFHDCVPELICRFLILFA